MYLAHVVMLVKIAGSCLGNQVGEITRGRAWWEAAMRDTTASAEGALANSGKRAPIRVIVADEDGLRREGLELLLSQSSNITCVGSHSSPASLFEAGTNVDCDVLLLHIKLGGSTSFNLIRELAAKPRGCKILVIVDCIAENCPVLGRRTTVGNDAARRHMPVVDYIPDDCLQIALKLGASGVIRNPSGFAELSQAIETVFSGKYVIEYPVATRLAMQYLATVKSHSSVETVDASQLTPREQQVLLLIAEGKSNKDISREMQISYSTVKNYVSTILRKLQMSDRTQLALYAVDSQTGNSLQTTDCYLTE